MPYYPKQGAIYDAPDERGRQDLRDLRRSKTIFNLLLKNFILRRKSPSYSVCIRRGYYGGWYKLMCRDKWSVSPVSGHLTNTIVLEIQGASAMMRERDGYPADNIVGVSYPNGKIVMNERAWELVMRGTYRNRRKFRQYMNAHYNATAGDNDWVYISKEFVGGTPEIRVPVQNAGVAFADHMNQWRV